MIFISLFLALTCANKHLFTMLRKTGTVYPLTKKILSSEAFNYSISEHRPLTKSLQSPLSLDRRSS